MGQKTECLDPELSVLCILKGLCEGKTPRCGPPNLQSHDQVPIRSLPIPGLQSEELPSLVSGSRIWCLETSDVLLMWRTCGVLVMTEVLYLKGTGGTWLIGLVLEAAS